ncbi:MAG: hypothetical protein QNL14_12115, partial [Deltaproteobacteria bacterium]|nr:hypothetical protein [Deltaproteobacteria bacterium]
PVATLPFTREVVLSDVEHTQLDRFLFGFTTAADTGDTQEAVIQNFEMTFIQDTDPFYAFDADWIP